MEVPYTNGGQPLHRLPLSDDLGTYKQIIHLHSLQA
jgi:hypothetical protein